MNKNLNLNNAKRKKNDEFYTQLFDIENELKHYKHYFKNKVVYCNCDKSSKSNFYKYFMNNFKELQLKRLITSCSDFRSKECIELLKQSDIVVTNPPFSLFREYVTQLYKYNKKFIIIGSMNAITYKEIFKLIKDNKLWFGHNWVKEFKQPDGTIKTFGNICWFTNLETSKRQEDLILYKKYNPKDYPKYDNYNVINVNRTKNIPMDYNGVMGVPISFLDKYNPDQFEIVGKTDDKEHAGKYLIGCGSIAMIKGKKLYQRIIIKNKRL